MSDVDVVDGDMEGGGMDAALAVAEEGLAAGELPIGAVVVVDGEVVARAHTAERAERRLLVHAELLALDAADRTLGAERRRAILFTTLEPCLMCLAATATAMVPRIVYGLASPGDGAADLARAWGADRTGDHPHLRLPAVVGGVAADRSRALFARYCAERPDATDGLTTWARTLL
jgi:tRNA(adenine34) deaminase